MKISDLIRRPVPPINVYHVPIHGDHSKKRKEKKDKDHLKEDNENFFAKNHNPHLGDNEEEHHSNLTDIHSDTWNKINGSGIKSYTGESRSLNTTLINYTKDPLHNVRHHKEVIDKIDHALNQSKMTHDVHVFHGTGWNVGAEAAKHPQGLINLPAYTSTSIRPGFAANCAKYDSDNQAHVIHIHVKKGHHGIYIGSHSQYPEEKELLLHRNTILKVHPTPTIEEHKGRTRHIWHAETMVSKPQTLDRDIALRSKSRAYKNEFNKVIAGNDVEKKIDVLKANPGAETHIVDQVHKEAQNHPDSSYSNQYHSLLAHPNISQHHVDAAIEKAGPGHLSAVVKNPNLHPHQMARILDHSSVSHSVMNRLAGHKNLSSEVIDKAMSLPHVEVKERFISHPNTSPDTLSHAIKNHRNNSDMMRAAISHPNLPDETFNHYLHHGDYDQKNHVMRNPKFTSQHFTDMIKNHQNHNDHDAHLINDSIRVATGKEDGTSFLKPEHVDHLLAHPSEVVRKSVANIPSNMVHDGHIHTMLKDPERSVQRAALRSFSDRMTPSHIETMIKSPHEGTRISAVKHPQASTKVLDTAMKDSSSQVRMDALLHPKATKEHYMMASKDADEDVRAYAAGYSSDDGVLHNLTQDKSHYVVRSLFSNSNLKQTHFDNIMKHPDHHMRALAMETNPRLVKSEHIHDAIDNNYLSSYHAQDLNRVGKMGESHFQKLAKGTSEKQSIAARYSKNPDLIHHLIKHGDQSVAVNAISNKNLGDKDIHKIIDEHHSDSYKMGELMNRSDINSDHIGKLFDKAPKHIVDEHTSHLSDLPDRVVDHFVGSKNKFHVENIASNPNLKPKHITKLINNQVGANVSHLYRHPSFNMKEHGSAFIKKHVTPYNAKGIMDRHYSDIQPEHAAAMFKHPDYGVKLEAVAHPMLSDHHIMSALKDDETKRDVAYNPSLKDKHLNHMIKNKESHWMISDAINANKKTGHFSSAMLSMAHKNYPYSDNVSSAIKEHPNCPPHLKD